MALIFIDGFDHYIDSTGGGEGTWSRIYGTNGDKSLTTGRYGGKALRVYSFGGLENVTRDLGVGGYSTFTHGFAVYIPAMTSIGITQYSDTSTYQLSINMAANGSLSVCRGDRGGTVISSTAAGVIPTTGWYYFEFTAVINATTGSVTLDVDGVNKISATGQNTNPTGTGNVRWIHYCEGGNGATLFFDDTYFSSDSTRFGPCRVRPMQPNSDVAGGAWTPSTGSTGYGCVGETTTDLDTTYIVGSNVGDTSLFGTPGTSASSVKAIAVEVVGKRATTNLMQVQSQLLSGSTQTDGALNTLIDTYETKQDVYSTDPNTGSAWTLSAANAVKIGVKVVT